ncbi:MAG: transposase [Chitinophagaceae bacterium]|nr:MAG: transposase [Chitinophagaceae bacterium]
MANKTILMSRIRQILRLYTEGTSKKKISELTGSSRNTVKKYIQKFHREHLTFEQVSEMTDHDLEQLFGSVEPVVKDARLDQLQTLLPEMEKQLKRKGMTILLLFEVYKKQYPNGYGITQFYKYFRYYLKRVQPVMHLEHKAGDKLYIDFAGEKLSILDTESGEIREVEVFVAVLGSSQLTYVEAVWSQKKEDLIRACESALHYYGGVPAAIVPDNLRSAVSKEIERETLKPLPTYPYEFKQQVMVTVMKNGHACLHVDKHYYSVPFRFIGKKVKILYTSTRVEIYHRYERIATHNRHFRKYHYTTLNEHLASSHRYLSEWTPEKFLEQAKAVHEEVAAYITLVIENKQHPEQAYKSCSGILSLVRKVGAARLTNACRRAQSYGVYNYPIIVQILEKNLDQQSEDEQQLGHTMPQHHNIRGADYYE